MRQCGGYQEEKCEPYLVIGIIIEQKEDNEKGALKVDTVIA
jgi:hypothetical protein